MDEIEQEERSQSEGPGDILVFLPGEREIREVSKTLRHADLRHTEVLPLYARLSASEQNRIFSPHAGPTYRTGHQCGGDIPDGPRHSLRD